jgi:ABC-type multidrug transport system permease subunit
MQKNSNKKSGAIISASVIVTIALLFVSIIVLVILGINSLIATWFLLLYIGVILAVIIGVLVSLAQRLKELKNGEAEEAKKY